jgi:hypothetical protein
LRTCKSELLALLGSVVAFAVFLIVASCRRSLRNPNGTPADNHDDPDTNTTPPRASSTESNQTPPDEEQPKHQGHCARIVSVIGNRDNWNIAFTGILAIATAVLSYIAFNTDTAVHDSAKAANDANKFNAASLRPWVFIDGTPATSLHYDNHGAHVGIAMTVGNTGRSPARYVLFDAKILPWVDPAVRERDKVCAELRKPKVLPNGINALFGSSAGFLLVPGQSVGWTPIITMSPDDISRREAMVVGQPLIIVGCVGYFSTFSEEEHTTRLIWELDSKRDGKEWLLIKPKDGDIPVEQLMLSRNPTLPWDAD